MTDGKNEYFIFQDIAGGQTEVIFFMHILLPIASQGGDNLYCLLIVVDDADLIERYEIIEAGNADTLAESDYSAVCREQFWDEEALIKIKTANGAH